MNINDPFNQKGPRGIFDFCLDFLEIIWVDHVLDLVCQHGLVDLSWELREDLWVTVVKLVAQWKSFHLVSLVFLFSFCENLCNRFLRIVSSQEFWAGVWDFFLVHLCFGHTFLVIVLQFLDCLNLAFCFLWANSIGRVINSSNVGNTGNLTQIFSVSGSHINSGSLITHETVDPAWKKCSAGGLLQRFLGIDNHWLVMEV